jgi:hypothetical protein
VGRLRAHACGGAEVGQGVGRVGLGRVGAGRRDPDRAAAGAQRRRRQVDAAPRAAAQGAGHHAARGGRPGAHASYIRLAPGRINTSIDGDGKDITLYLAPDGRLYDRSESSSGAGSPSDDIQVGRIPAGAPWKIVRALGEKAGIRPHDVDYMLIQVDSISGKAEWLVYLKGVNRSYYRAALNGAHPTRCC